MPKGSGFESRHKCHCVGERLINRKRCEGESSMGPSYHVTYASMAFSVTACALCKAGANVFTL